MRLRLAQTADLAALREVMALSIAALLPAFLPPEQVEASFEVMGLDTLLIDDQTYFVVEREGEILGCGGWSRRNTLFGGNHTSGRNPALLDPASEPARVRAMYTHPGAVRQGVGKRILAACEDAARAEGFTRAQMAATMAGAPLYQACGYVEIERFAVRTSNGVEVPLLRMEKPL